MIANGKVLKYGDNVDTDVIIPARYLNSFDAKELASHVMVDLDPTFVDRLEPGDIVVAKSNFGCGSSRAHAPWVLECNNINLVIAVNFARIFRQNRFNCGLAAISLSEEAIDDIFANFAGSEAECKTDLDACEFTISNAAATKVYKFEIAPFDLELVKAGGWVAYADKNY
jgi:3-isopropylmalate/(R)-2-methylmalate dehydratase small subunit